MTAKVILNPYSNRWNSQKRWPEAEAALKAAGVNFKVEVSHWAGKPQLGNAAWGASFPSERALPAGGFGSVHTPSP